MEKRKGKGKKKEEAEEELFLDLHGVKKVNQNQWETIMYIWVSLSFFNKKLTFSRSVFICKISWVGIIYGKQVDVTATVLYT